MKAASNVIQGAGWGILIVVLGYFGLNGLDSLSNTPKTTSNLIQSESSGIDAFDRPDDPETERSYEDTGDMDCSDFSSQSEAQDFFESEGGPDEDYHNLDRDGDGYVCESL